MPSNLIAPASDPYRWFSDDERRLAEWIQDRGASVRSVERREGQRERTPDAVLTPASKTVEFKKSVCSTTAIVREVRSGRKQSRRIAIDARGRGADKGVATPALAGAIKLYGLWIDEVVVVTSDDCSLGWWYGRDPRAERRLQGGRRR